MAHNNCDRLAGDELLKTHLGEATVNPRIVILVSSLMLLLAAFAIFSYATIRIHKVEIEALERVHQAELQRGRENGIRERTIQPWIDWVWASDV